jgi:hypothetical protein
LTLKGFSVTQLRIIVLNIFGIALVTLGVYSYVPLSRCTNAGSIFNAFKR